MKNKILIIYIIISLFSFYITPMVLGENDVNTIVVNLDEEVEKETVDDTELIDNGMKELESQKEDLQDAIKENEAQMGIVSEQLSSVLAEVEELSIKIAEKEREIKNIELEELGLIEYIEDAEQELKNYTLKYEKDKKALEARLVAMYEMGETKYLDVLLNSESLSDFLSRYYLISEITEADYNLVSSVKENKERTETIAKSLKQKKEQLEQDKLEKEKYQISLSNMEILKNNKLANLNQDELNLHNEIEEYRNQITNIEFEIKQLALQNLGKQYIGGNFVWPTPGYTTITSKFGMRTHPITGIYKLHTGMDIGAPLGSTFVAANDGVVVKSEMNFAYGNMVVIDHGGGVTTLYAHGSEILVSVGDTVTQGQAVLKVGSTRIFNRASCSF